MYFRPSFLLAFQIHLKGLNPFSTESPVRANNVVIENKLISF